MSMRIERSSLDQVKKRFESNKKKMEEKKKDYDIEVRMKELKEEVNDCNIFNKRIQIYWFSDFNIYIILF